MRQYAIAFGLTALALGLVGCGGSSSGVSTVPAPSGETMFYSRGMSIYYRPIAGGAETLVTTASAGVQGFEVKPDKTKIMYGAGGNIYVVNVDGTGTTQIMDAKSASWMPTGSKIYRVTASDQLVSANLDGSGQMQIFDGNFGGGIYLARPNATNSKLVMNYSPSGWAQIYTLNTDGSGLTAISPSGVNNYDPSFNPAGNKIVYQSDSAGDNDIYIMNSDGTGKTALTGAGNNETFPTFSPDGTKIYFLSDAGGAQNIWRMNADGTGPVQLTSFSTSINEVMVLN